MCRFGHDSELRGSDEMNGNPVFVFVYPLDYLLGFIRLGSGIRIKKKNKKKLKIFKKLIIIIIILSK
jgi:hypothetical protein